jgi:predicted nuclease of predicted toxin-antitoxin system
MRLLFDEQLSEALPAMLADVFPGSLHVRQLAGAARPTNVSGDSPIAHDCLLVSKDEDFHRPSVLRGAPPKIVWLRIGNCRTEAVADLLERQAPALQLFAEQEEATFLALG